MDVSIIICTSNRGPSLKQTLISLLQVRLIPALEHELILVETGIIESIEGTLLDIERKGIKIKRISEPRKGLARARNRGVLSARGKVFLFTDDDVELPPDWLDAMCQPILVGKADAVAGQVVIAPNLQRPWMGTLHRAFLASTDGLNFNDLDRMVGANMAVSQKVFEKVPLFDEELGAGALAPGEETLFTWQLMKAGFRLAASMESRLIHNFEPHRLMRGQWLKAAKQFGRAEAYLTHHWKHKKITGPVYFLFCARTGYWIRRLIRWRQCLKKEGIPGWELYFLVRIAFLKSYLMERHRPHKYEKEGLVKIPSLDIIKS